MFIKLKGQTIGGHLLNRVVSNEDTVKIVLQRETIRVACPGIGKQVHDEIDQALSKKTTQMLDIDALIVKVTPEPEEEPVEEEEVADTEAPEEEPVEEAD